ncbi:hypothetical protein [Halosolutus halophilus]|uniref:hypothetical protein n=1 Tax=Halosolutus halophilus TaxID=1552990 RepID=UPI0022351689|nr:hypothetical protein [Halosolutus halophilus]
MHNNVVDEEPSYEQDDLTTDRIRLAVGAYLREIDAPVRTWEAFNQLSLHDDYQGDAAKERDALEDALYEVPDREWYFENPDAHTLAPALARTIFRAEERANGRRFGKTMHEPPRLEASVRDDDEWNREWVSVVLDESNDVRSDRRRWDRRRGDERLRSGDHAGVALVAVGVAQAHRGLDRADPLDG